MPNTFMDNTST